jgi:hypothetical protein
VCAGAVRETVYSVPEVIRRINADFVPVALSAFAALPEDDEGTALRSIYRSKVQPQGTCVLNSGGQVLAWVLMFDRKKSVLDFLDHGLERFRDHPDAKEPIMTERYMRFPSAKLEDMKDEAKPRPFAGRHAGAKHCPGAPDVAPGTVVARVIGRALGEDGKPSARPVNQEHLALDRFEVAPAMQEKLAEALAESGKGRTALPDAFVRLCMAHAFLGNKDSGPMTKVSVFTVVSDVKRAEFWARRVEGRGSLWRVTGETEVRGEGNRGDFGVRHEVKLTWEGYIEMAGKRLARLLLAARGEEKLKWGSGGLKAQAKTVDEVAFLPSGRFIDMECGVRYGIIGELTGRAPRPEQGRGAPPDAGQFPDEARKQLVEVLGGPFLVFRDKVQEELKLSEGQKQKLLEKFPEYVRATMKVFEKIKEAKPEEREKTMREHCKKSDEKLSALLREVLEAKQQERLFQLRLRQAGVFALMGENMAFTSLKITDEQRKQFKEVIQEMQKKIEPLAKEAQKRGDKPDEIMAKVKKVRKEHEGKIEAILTDAQKKQWKELLGKPFDLKE